MKTLDRSNYLNPPIDEGLDTDYLTKQELLELGYKEARKRHKKQVAKKCTDCNRPVAAPITSYTFHGIEVLEPGEAIHQGCLNKRVDALIAVILNDKN